MQWHVHPAGSVTETPGSWLLCTCSRKVHLSARLCLLSEAWCVAYGNLVSGSVPAAFISCRTRQMVAARSILPSLSCFPRPTRLYCIAVSDPIHAFAGSLVKRSVKVDTGYNTIETLAQTTCTVSGRCFEPSSPTTALHEAASSPKSPFDDQPHK